MRYPSVLTLVLVGLFALTVNAQRFDGGETGETPGDSGFDGGDGGEPGPGCCGVPLDLEEYANVLLRDFRKTNSQTLRTRQFVGEICKKHDCGELTEVQASRLLDGFFDAADRIAIMSDRVESRWTSRISVLVSAVGLLIAWAAYRQSRRNERDIGAIQERSRIAKEFQQ